MNKNKEKIDKLYHKLGLKHNIPKEELIKLIESPYEFTKQEIDKLNLKEIKTQEEFDKIKTNFIYKYLGKLHTSFNVIDVRRKRKENYKNINKKRWEKKNK